MADALSAQLAALLQQWNQQPNGPQSVAQGVTDLATQTADVRAEAMAAWALGNTGDWARAAEFAERAAEISDTAVAATTERERVQTEMETDRQQVASAREGVERLVSEVGGLANKAGGLVLANDYSERANKIEARAPTGQRSSRSVSPSLLPFLRSRLPSVRVRMRIRSTRH